MHTESSRRDAPTPPSRSSFWVRTLDTARAHGDWMLVPRYYTQATAAQITSDIVNAPHRDPSTIRVKGILPGERWEARWTAASDGASGDHVVWIRLAGHDG
ncbi:MAG: hypothetical protein ACOYMR_10425 [Ilumatobacteraceae bacterium]